MTPLQIIDMELAIQRTCLDDCHEDDVDQVAFEGAIEVLERVREKMIEAHELDNCFVASADGRSLSMRIQGLDAWVFKDSHSAEQVRRMNEEQHGPDAEIKVREVELYIKD